MRLTNILSDRHYQTWPSWQIVFEWEQEISTSLNLPVLNSPKETSLLYRKFIDIDNNLLNGKLHGAWNEVRALRSGYSLYFEMVAKYYKSFSNNSKTVPVIIDFWDKKNVENFKTKYKKCPYLLITSLEFSKFLRENKTGNKLIHFPMSLPSKYKLMPDQIFEKKYDILLAGRTNSVLWNYLKQFEIQHPEIEYLQQVDKNGEIFYESNKKGIVGKVHTREEYINLIRSSKISFYSTPGIDGGEKRTNGFNPVTPRFFELLSAGCHIIAKYPKNLDTDFFALETIVPSANSYDEFQKQLTNALNSPAPINRNAKYLLKHYMSERIKLLNEIE